MIRFLIRRLALAIGILLVLSIIMYSMLNLALDPLDDLRTSTAPNKNQLIQMRVQQLELDKPWYVRYFHWLTHFVQGDPGIAFRSTEPVAKHLGPAIATSVQLVFSATILSILVGVTIGILAALRQYTGFDYAITFVSFLMFSLPVFWVAVLLKQYLGIGFNDFLADPKINWPLVLGLGVLSGLFWAGALAGTWMRRIVTFLIAFAVTVALLAFVLGSGWLQNPSIGIIGIAVLGLATAVVATAILAGIRNRRALGAAITTALVGVASYYACQWLFFYVPGNFLMLFGLLILAIGLGCLIGFLWGGPDKGVSMQVAAIVALVISVLTFIDRVMQTWAPYNKMSVIRHRPIGTIGSQTPGLNGDFWMTRLDSFTHLILPTLALVLISFAGYTRYQRGSLLEVFNQDYIRTARAKGLSERVVVVRHALRNALLPLASIIPVDIVLLMGGALMSETIFGWSGMGKYFVDSLNQSEINPAMTYVIFTGALAMVANLVADFLYAVLDPRIRVNA